MTTFVGYIFYCSIFLGVLYMSSSKRAMVDEMHQDWWESSICQCFFKCIFMQDWNEMRTCYGPKNQKYLIVTWPIKHICPSSSLWSPLILALKEIGPTCQEAEKLLFLCQRERLQNFEVFNGCSGDADPYKIDAAGRGRTGKGTNGHLGWLLRSVEFTWIYDFSRASRVHLPSGKLI